MFCAAIMSPAFRGPTIRFRAHSGVAASAFSTIRFRIWRFGGAIKLAASSQDNAEDRINDLNERSNDIAVDQLFVRWRAGENTSLLLGKAAFPLELSPLVWDADLRPVGVSGQTRSRPAIRPHRADRRLLQRQPPYGDESRIGAVEAAYRWHEGAPTSAGMLCPIWISRISRN